MIYWFLRWLLATVATVLVAGLLLLISSYLLLRTPLFYQTLLPQVRPLLVEYNVRLERLASLEIDLLRGIKLSGLELHWQQKDQGWLALNLAEFELRYALPELLQQRLLIETVAFKNLDLQGELTLTPAAKKAEESKAGWQSLVQLPLPLLIKKISLEQSHFNLTLLQESEKLLIESDLDYQATLHWQKGEIKSQQNFELSALNVMRHSGDELQKLTTAAVSGALLLNLLDLEHQPQLNFNANLDLTGDRLLHKTADLQLSLQPQWQLTVKGELADLQRPLETGMVQFEQKIGIKTLELEQFLDEKERLKTLQMAEQQAVVRGSYKQGQFQLQSEFSQRQLQLPQLKQALNSRQTIRFVTDLSLSQPQLNAQFFLQDQPLLLLNLKVENAANRLMLKPKITLYARQNLLAYSELAKPLHQFGGQKIELTTEVELQHRQENIQSAGLGKLMQWPAAVAGQVSLTQLSRPKQKGSPVYQQPIHLDFSLKKNELYQIELKLKAPELKLAELKRAVAIEWQNRSEFQWPLQQSNATGSLRVDQKPALSYQLNLDDQDKKANMSASLNVTLDPQWQRYHASLAQLKQLGRTELNLDLKALLQHPKNNLLSLQESDLSQSQIKVQSKITAKQLSQGTLLQFKKPLELKQQLNWSGRVIELANQFKAEQFSVTDLFKAKNVEAELALATDVLPIPKKVQLTFSADAESLIVKQDFETASLLFPLSLQAKGRQTGRQLELDEFNLDLSKKLLQLEMSANFDPQSNSGQARGLLQSRLRPNLLQQPLLSGSGKVSLPWQVSLEEGQRASLEAEMNFTDFALSLDQLALNNINGSLKIAEELQLKDDNTLAFRYLLHIDPFQRVDYSRVQPQLLSRQNLSIERMQLDRYQAGPLHASLGLEQNLLRLQQFDLALYGGFITGQFYLDATPGNWKVGLLSRLSQINFQSLLADDSAYKNSPQKPISARTALEFDLKRRLLEGRIDISDISREQLLQLLELFDPKYEDEQLAKVRAALQIAYPEWLAISMQKGLLDLELSLSLIPGTLKVQNLPLTPILQRFAGAALNKIEALPLQ